VLRLVEQGLGLVLEALDLVVDLLQGTGGLQHVLGAASIRFERSFASATPSGGRSGARTKLVTVLSELLPLMIGKRSGNSRQYRTA
jgi:hypothetical protein